MPVLDLRCPPSRLPTGGTASLSRPPSSPRLQGHIAANGVPLQASKVRSGYVQQDDLFYPQLTVRETLLMAAELRMRGQGGEEERRAHVEEVIARLGLAQVRAAHAVPQQARMLTQGAARAHLHLHLSLIPLPPGCMPACRRTTMWHLLLLTVGSNAACLPGRPPTRVWVMPRHAASVVVRRRG